MHGRKAACRCGEGQAGSGTIRSFARLPEAGISDGKGKNTSIILSDHFAEYTRRKVESGEFGSTSEVVREALRLHEERSQFKDRLLEAIDKGLASPLDENFDIDRWFEDEFGPE